MAKRTGRSVKRRSSKGLISTQRKREVLGLLLMSLSVLLTLAVISYDPADEGLARNFTLSGALSPHDNQAQNWLGLTGALVAWLLVPNFLGYPIVLITGVVFAWGYVIFRHRTPILLPLITFLTAIGVILVAATVGWFSHRIEADLLLWSGAIGLGVSGWMMQVFGTAGAMIILGLLLVISLLLLIDHDIQRSMDRVENGFRRFSDWMEQRWAAFREGREERAEARAKASEERAERRAEERARRDAERQRATEEKAQEEPAPTKPDIPTPPPPKQQPAAPPPAPFDAPQEHTEPPAAEPVKPVDDDEDAVIEELVRSRREPGGDGTSRQEPALNIRERVQEEEADLESEHRDSKPVDEEIPYEFPAIDLLDPEPDKDHDIDVQELEENKRILLDKLDTYNIQISHIDAVVGPTITLYELTPAPGVKISRITALEDDLAMAMAARGIRLIAPIPGKSAVGVEIPNRHRELVRIRSTLHTARFRDAKMNLPAVLGKTIEGEVYIEDLTKMPHLLIAGATGSGKSVGLNALIAGLLYACHPSNLKFVMIDPKKIELAQYVNTLNHFIATPEEADDPIITDFTQAVGVLKSCEKEMENRYDLLSDAMVRGIADYNRKFHDGKLNPENGHRHLPYIVVIVDELADLMLTAGKEIEGPIARLAQMSRAVGIHLVLATQRPSVDVITGLIKANFPARVAYQVASKVDSRTILDQNGAEQLVGNGDLLYMVGSRIIRLQGPFIGVEEVERLTSFIGRQRGSGPYYLPPVVDEGSGLTDNAVGGEDTDDLFQEAARIIVRSQQGSVSLLQRKLSIGYTRAARIVDQLEQAGIVGPFEGSKARQVLVQDEMHLDSFLKAGK